MKKFFAEFKAFAIKGNVMSMAVGVMIGAAFQGVVSSFTENILSPIIGMVGGKNFDALEWHIQRFDVTIKYGAFITNFIDFLIVAFVVFLMIKGMNRLLEGKKTESAPPAPATKPCPFCLEEIKIEATRCPHCTAEIRE